MQLKTFNRLLLIAVFCISACQPRKQPDAAEQMIKDQNAQISKLVDISKKQSEQISTLVAELEAERKATHATRARVEAPATQPQQANTIAGSAYITREGGGSTIVRDMQVLLLTNAQIRWTTCVKAATAYSSPNGVSDYKENQLRSDLAQFAGNIADLIAVQMATDGEGKYKFQNIPAGDYYLFAQYSDAASTICWFIPVHVMQQEGAALEVNLANSTAYATAFRETK